MARARFAFHLGIADRSLALPQSSISHPLHLDCRQRPTNLDQRASDQWRSPARITKTPFQGGIGRSHHSNPHHRLRASDATSPQVEFPSVCKGGVWSGWLGSSRHVTCKKQAERQAAGGREASRIPLIDGKDRNTACIPAIRFSAHTHPGREIRPRVGLSGEQDFDATGLARAYVDMFVSAPLPQSVCVYTRNGPYAFDNAYFANQGYVTRHLYENVLDLPNIIVGTINNWIFHPGSNRLTRTAKEGSILPRDMGKAERLQEGFMHRLGVLSKTAQSYVSEEYIDEMMASTGINFFGQATTEASASVVMPQSATNNYVMAERIIPDEVPDAVRDHPTQLEAYKQLQKSALTERREIQL